MSASLDGPAPGAGRSRLRRRFLVAGIAGLSVLGPMLGVSFLGDSGTTATTISGSSSPLVYTSSLPCGMFGSSTTSDEVTLKDGVSATSTDPATCGTAPGASFSGPKWSPVANSPGAVTTAGDLGVVDASTATSDVILDVYVTNLQDLAKGYSSFALPIDIYSSPCTSGSCTWGQITDDTSYITSSDGFYSVSLPPPASGNLFYDVTIGSATQGDGGEYYCIDTSVAANLAPQFFLTASTT